MRGTPGATQRQGRRGLQPSMWLCCPPLKAQCLLFDRLQGKVTRLAPQRDGRQGPTLLVGHALQDLQAGFSLSRIGQQLSTRHALQRHGRQASAYFQDPSANF